MSKTRMTKQRKTILDVLKNTTSHPTADWIYEQVKKEIPNVSLGTIYRNLNLLAEMNKITVINYANDQSHYDGNTEVHYHFRCNNCQRVYDLHLELFEKEINNHPCENLHKYTYTHTNMRTHMLPHKCTRTKTYIQTCMHTRVCSHILTRVCTHTHTRMHTYTHAHTYAFT
jgi:Fur family peroxide stress response transcriptional regulator